MIDSIVVRSVDELENFRRRMMEKKEEIEQTAAALMQDCVAQHQNWEDPRYDSLKENLETFLAALKSSTAFLDDSNAYIAKTVDRLRNI